MSRNPYTPCAPHGTVERFDDSRCRCDDCCDAHLARRRKASTVSFTFPAPGKRLSMNDRLHWARKAGITSLWRQTAHYYTRRNLGRFPNPPVASNVLVTFEVSDPNRRRDPSNMMPTVKAIVDGITDAGAWPDDDSRWVTVIEPRFVKGNNRVRIDITPRDAA